MRRFPQELVDLVIDVVGATADNTDIGTCGLICRQWLPRTRRHLFSGIDLSNADPASIQEFLDLVDASCTPILPLVKSLNMCLVNGPFTEAHMARLNDCHAVSELHIDSPPHISGECTTPVEDLSFQCWLQTHIPQFGAACLSLARFELVLGSDMPLRILVDVISSLPSLTHLRICGEESYGLLASDAVPATDTLPPNLHTLDMSLRRGTNLFFEWLLSCDKTLVLTSLTLGGRANGAPIWPIEAYLKRVGTEIEALTISYWADGLKATYAFEDHVLTFTNKLVHLSLARQYPHFLGTRLAHPASSHLARISIEVRPVPDHILAELSSLNTILGTSQYRALRHISFTDEVSKEPFNIAQLRAVMPQANQRGILN
ncbi:hypothetical protein B0H17DRAFT_1339001 [Mycena rosella]|uniref:Uncharacterized protein n=1 Tax=Mycena rosella TaxID=1033263 RepID=A0AAD7CD89_MYCRO|nr:hypothetical protein B0H17DRAFT_1339001 [Mycena rosella]